MIEKIGIKNKIELLNKIEQIANIGIWTWDTKKDILMWSSQLYQIYGIKQEEFKPDYQSYLELVHPEDKEYVDNQVSKALLDKKGLDFVHRIIRPDGEIRVIHSLGSVNGQDRRDSVMLMGVAQDITKRVRVEQELKEKEVIEESEKRLRVLLDQNPAPVAIVDALGRFTYASFTNQGIFGYSPDDLMGKPAFGFIHTADRALARRRLSELLLHPDRVLTTELRVKHKDGTMRWVRAIGKNLLRDPYVRGVVINYEDITTRKRLQMATREMAAIVESSDDAIIGKTFEGTITNWNKGAEKIYGYTAAEAVGHSIFLLIPQKEKKKIRDILKKVGNGKKIEHFETKRLRKDGSEVDVSVTFSPIKDGQGNIVGISGIERDVTARKQEEKAKDEFIAAFSHELRNPLTPILTNLELIKGHGLESRDLKNSISVIERQTNNMKTLLDDLLDIVRITQGILKLHKKKIDLKDIVNNAIETSRPHIDARGHRLKVNMCRESLKVEADPLRIEQVLVNILTNAAKYMENSGRIDISCEKEDGQALVKVRDRGYGLSQKEQQRIFELFAQGEQSLSRPEGGLGIGLALSKRLIDLHDGAINVHSEGKNKGSTFVMCLPL